MEEPQLSNREKLFIQMAIDQYQTIYLQAAKENNQSPISERDYVALALENYEEFEQHIAQCQLLGHILTTITLGGGKSFTGCTRCGATNQLSELLLVKD